MPRAEQRFVGPSYKRSRGGSSHRAWRVPQGHSPPGRRARPNAAFPGPRRRGGPETDETLHLRLLRAVYRADVEVQAVLGRLAFRYSHEDERRDTWSPSHLLHQIGRFMLPRRLHFSILSISRHRRPSRPFYTPSYRSPCVPSAWATATHVRA